MSRFTEAEKGNLPLNLMSGHGKMGTVSKDLQDRKIDWWKIPNLRPILSHSDNLKNTFSLWNFVKMILSNKNSNSSQISAEK